MLRMLAVVLGTLVALLASALMFQTHDWSGALFVVAGLAVAIFALTRKAM